MQKKFQLPTFMNEKIGNRALKNDDFSGKMVQLVNPQTVETLEAFDGVASIYDGPFGNNSLIRRMRKTMWKEIMERAPAGANILDMGCGTGIDAIHFAKQGYHIHAVDGSANMIEMTRKRAESQGVLNHVEPKQCDLNRLADVFDNRFDVIYSNFGALNCVLDISGLAENCSMLFRPGGSGFLIMNVMGKYCPWETMYYLLHGHPRRAFFRWSNRFRSVPLGKGKVWVRYYRPMKWYQIFKKRFELVHYQAMSLVVPPPYLESWISHHTGLLDKLEKWDDKISEKRFFRGFGDHFLITMKLRK